MSSMVVLLAAGFLILLIVLAVIILAVVLRDRRAPRAGDGQVPTDGVSGNDPRDMPQR